MSRSSDNSEEILSRLDIAAEYRSMGVEFTAPHPSADGWLECWAVGRPHGDKPNAGCNVQTGRYHDFGKGGDHLSLWDFAARYGGHTTWQTARDHFAQVAGVEVTAQHAPKARKPDEHLQFEDWNDVIVGLWLRHKKGVTAEALQAAGARLARYRHQYTVIALPVFSWPLSDTPKPIGWVMWNTTGGELPIFKAGSDAPTWAKMKTTGGSSSGLMGLSALQAIAAGTVERAVKVEGPTDMLAAWAITPADQRHRIVFTTNSTGASEHPRTHELQAFSGRPRVDVIHDADVAGEAGLVRWSEAIAAVAPDVRRARLPYPVEEKKGKDLRDWINERLTDPSNGPAKAFADLLQLLDAGEPARADSRPDIEITPDEHLCNEAVVGALGRDPVIYSRGTILVHVIPAEKDGDPETDLIVRPKGTSLILHLPKSLLRERITKNAKLYRMRGDARAHVHPTDWLVNGVADRGRWPGLRRLEGVVNCPVIRADGTILDTPGWDQRTGLLYEPSGEFPAVPDQPTHADAVAAVEVLYDLVCDFPFEKPEHRAAWLLFLLTVFARYAFKGCAPLFLVDSNVRGSGKSLLNDLVSIIFNGLVMPRMSNARDDEECRKRITAIAVAGDSMVLFDNIAGDFGCQSLDAALTSTTWKDRLLGATTSVTLPLLVTWSGSGNQVQLKGDIPRRICWIKLLCLDENPEEREGFKYARIKAHTLKNRGQYIVAALTILRAYHVAGRPQVPGVKPWGSYEEWSDLVRMAAIWAGCPDPAETRREMADKSHSETATLRAVIEGWKVYRGTEGVTTGQIIKDLEEKDDKGRYDEFREALMTLCRIRDRKLPSASALGMHLKRVEDRVIGGWRITSTERGSANKKFWTVSEVVTPTNHDHDVRAITHVKAPYRYDLLSQTECIEVEEAEKVYGPGSSNNSNTPNAETNRSDPNSPNSESIIIADEPTPLDHAPIHFDPDTAFPRGP